MVLVLIPKSKIELIRYFVNLKNLELIIPEILQFKEKDLLYMDEIGQMELFSEKFKELVLKFLDSENISILTISNVFKDDFIENIRKRDDIILIEISKENREEQKKFILQLLE